MLGNVILDNVQRSTIIQKIDDQVLTPCGYIPGVGVLTGSVRAATGAIDATVSGVATGVLALGSAVGPTKSLRMRSRRNLPEAFARIGRGVRHVFRGGLEAVGFGPVLKYRDTAQALQRKLLILEAVNVDFQRQNEELKKKIYAAEDELAKAQTELSTVRAVKEKLAEEKTSDEQQLAGLSDREQAQERQIIELQAMIKVAHNKIAEQTSAIASIQQERDKITATKSLRK